MNTITMRIVPLALVLALLAVPSLAQARIDGLPGPEFLLTVRDGHITTPDGGSIYTWGYAARGQLMQYPGPVLIVEQGTLVTVRLINELPPAAGNVSMSFPGQQVEATGGAPGLITREAPPDGVTEVVYTFLASRPGTFLYQSATRPDLQIEMGLVGALIVRPPGGEGLAYGHPDTRFDHEYLFLLTEMDPRIHQRVELGDLAGAAGLRFFPVLWFINGRAAPDTMAPAFAPWLPHQPYDCMPRMRPGERLLMRVLGAGRDLHPFHHHGNHARVIARDGHLLSTAPAAGADLSYEVFTIQAVPGQTTDAIFEWTGARLGWDIYGNPAENGHACMDMDGDLLDDSTSEYCPDHGKAFPVVLPELADLTLGGGYSGSPFLGGAAALPPGEGGMNPNNGLGFMWHSHTEKEMTNNDIFPGGMMTMFFVEPPGTPMH